MSMKKQSTLLAVLFLSICFGLTSCIKLDVNPTGTTPAGVQLRANQAALQFSISNNRTGLNYFENDPAYSAARYGQLYSNVQGFFIEGYVPSGGGQELSASITLENWPENPLAAGQTIRIQPVGRATQGLITLESVRNGQYFDPWYSDYGQIYISNYDGNYIEGRFSARMYRNDVPDQVMDITDGRFIARVR